MQKQLKLDGLLSQSKRQSGDVARLTPTSAQKQPRRFVLFVRQIARRVAAARDQHALRWYADKSASRGM
jgi:hypothetical protein